MAAFPYSKTEIRTEFALFSKPIAKSRTVFFYNQNQMEKFDFSELNNLKNFLIGGVRGYYYEARLLKAGLHIDYSENEDDAFKKLFFGKVDIVPVNELVGWQIINRLFPEKKDIFSTSKTALDENNLNLMVSKAYPDSATFLEHFNRGLKTIKATGAYKEIIEKYGLPQTTGAFP